MIVQLFPPSRLACLQGTRLCPLAQYGALALRIAVVVHGKCSAAIPEPGQLNAVRTAG